MPAADDSKRKAARETIVCTAKKQDQEGNAEQIPGHLARDLHIIGMPPRLTLE